MLRYILKGLWGHRMRTLLTVSGAAVAMFVSSFVGAVQEGLARLSQDAQAERVLIVFQANRFCPFTSRLPEDYAARIARLPGVADVVPIQVFLNNCRASLDLVAFNGIPPAKLRTARAFHVIAGTWADFEGRRDAALVGRVLARRRGLSIGQRFSVGAAIVTVAGIFAADVPAEENVLYTHLEFLQRTPGLNAVGTVTQFEVRLQDGADAATVCKRVDALFRGGPIQTDTRPKGVFQQNAVADLVDLIGFARYLGLACLGLVLALVATTTIMAVQDRLREHAVLQAVGFSGPRIFCLVIIETTLVSLAGGVIGVGLALAVLATSGLAVGTEGVTIAFEPSLRLGVVGLLETLALGLLAGLVPAWRAARPEIVISLRAI